MMWPFGRRVDDLGRVDREPWRRDLPSTAETVVGVVRRQMEAEGGKVCDTAFTHPIPPKTNGLDDPSIATSRACVGRFTELFPKGCGPVDGEWPEIPGLEWSRSAVISMSHSGISTSDPQPYLRALAARRTLEARG